MPWCRRKMPLLIRSGLILGLIWWIGGLARAHDFPNEVILLMFVKPEGDRLHVLLRVPLELLLNLDLPKRGPGYLDLAQIDPALKRAAAVIADQILLFENGDRLFPERFQGRISLYSDRSFESYEKALALIEGPQLPESTNVFWNQGFFDLHLEYAIRSERSDFALEAHMGPEIRRRLHLVVRFILPDGTIRAYNLVGDFGRVALDPRWHQAARTFVRLGFLHILEGIDHILFLIGAIIPFRRDRLKSLLAVVTSFTIAHSITLLISAMNLGPQGAWFPPLVETLIAASILYMALENAVGAGLSHRWLITGAFGLVHGFGFSYGLQRSFQFAGGHLLLSLFAFNVGVELGQLVILALILLARALLFRYVISERIGILILSAFLGHTAWHWMLERAAQLQYVEWPRLDMILLLRLASGLLLFGLIGASFWLLAQRSFWEDLRRQIHVFFKSRMETD